MKKNTRNRRYTRREALTVHVDANKSDPFASRRAAMSLAKFGHGETKAMTEEGQRLVAARTARIKRLGAADWLSVDQIMALNVLRNDLRKESKRSHIYGKRADILIVDDIQAVAA